MKPDSALIKLLRFTTLSDSSTRLRCEICAIAVLLELFVYVTYTATDWKSLPWFWVAALDVGFVSGTYALCSARSWRGRLVAAGLLSFHLVSLLFLLFIGFLQKTMPIIH